VIFLETFHSPHETYAMTAPSSVDSARFLHEQLASMSPDLLRSMLTMFIDTLMSAEADAVCGAGYGEISPERVNTRHCYRHREFDTRAGTLDVAIPKLRSGSYFPDWLLERRRRAERALTTVVATCYLPGVSTRRMEKLVESLGITRLSKSHVSVMAAELDAVVADFRSRPLDQGPYTFVAADALVLKVREGGRVVNVHALVATGVNGDGHREILGLQVTSAEDPRTSLGDARAAGNRFSMPCRSGTVCWPDATPGRSTVQSGSSSIRSSEPDRSGRALRRDHPSDSSRHRPTAVGRGPRPAVAPPRAAGDL
jgi:hypothetical protein